MAEHAAAKARAVEGRRAAPAKVQPDPRGELLNRRSEERLAPSRELLQRRAEAAPAAAPSVSPAVERPRPNRTGLPDRLKAGVEALSGVAMDDVRVHRNSSAPAKLGALAYAQGTEIHLGPGQEEHLPHEAWHVVQQKQGRVQTTRRSKGGVGINDDPVLEREADSMPARSRRQASAPTPAGAVASHASARLVQLQPITKEAAEEALAQHAPAFDALPHTIITPWGNDPEDSNCHGYTVHGEVARWIDGADLLGQLGNNPAIVFVRNGAIAHSGRPDGAGNMTHFLITVGIVRSAIGDQLAGYEARYTLPNDREALEAYLQQQQEAEDAANAAVAPWEHRKEAMATFINETADDAAREAASVLIDRLYDMIDEPAHPDAAQVLAEYEVFTAEHDHPSGGWPA